MAYSPALRSVLEKVGGPTVLAKYLGISASAVTQWHDVPGRHLLRASALSGIPPEKIRPDLAPTEELRPDLYRAAAEPRP